MSLGIVEAHGGTLTVDCPLEGGAVFTIALPVGAVEATDADAEPPSKPNASQRRILIVDDEAEIREALAEILTGARHRVVTASSGREALERMAAEHYDVILTDIRMPDLDGRALYQEIERRWPGQAGRVVFVTGDTLASALREFVSESGRPVIEKPFLPSEVRRVVAELAWTARQRHPAERVLRKARISTTRCAFFRVCRPRNRSPGQPSHVVRGADGEALPVQMGPPDPANPS